MSSSIADAPVRDGDSAGPERPLPPEQLSLRRRYRALLITGGLFASLAVTTWLIAVSETGVGDRLSADVADPSHVIGGAAYAHEPLWGVENWPLLLQVSTIISAVLTYGYAVWLSRMERGVHPTLVMLIVATGISLLADPLISWSQYIAYDPRMWHIPESWPFFNIVPTVEPSVLIPGYACFFVWSSVPGLWIHQKITARSSRTAWIVRKPLPALFLIAGSIAFVIDEIQAFMATRTDQIIYTQIATRASRAGETWQSNACGNHSCASSCSDCVRSRSIEILTASRSLGVGPQSVPRGVGGR